VGSGGTVAADAADRGWLRKSRGTRDESFRANALEAEVLIEVQPDLEIKLKSVTNLLTNQHEPGVTIVNLSDEPLKQIEFVFDYDYGDGSKHLTPSVFPVNHDGVSILGIELLGIDVELPPGECMEAVIFNGDQKTIAEVRSVLASVSLEDCHVSISGSPGGRVSLNIYSFSKLFQQHFGV
jgi:hypothetical protein